MTTGINVLAIFLVELSIVFGRRFFFRGSFMINGKIRATMMAIRPHEMKRLCHPRNGTRRADVAKAAGTAMSPAALPSPKALPLLPGSKASDNKE